MVVFEVKIPIAISGILVITCVGTLYHNLHSFLLIASNANTIKTTSGMVYADVEQKLMKLNILRVFLLSNYGFLP